MIPGCGRVLPHPLLFIIHERSLRSVLRGVLRSASLNKQTMLTQWWPTQLDARMLPRSWCSWVNEITASDKLTVVRQVVSAFCGTLFFYYWKPVDDSLQLDPVISQISPICTRLPDVFKVHVSQTPIYVEL